MTLLSTKRSFFHQPSTVEVEIMIVHILPPQDTYFSEILIHYFCVTFKLPLPQCILKHLCNSINHRYIASSFSCLFKYSFLPFPPTPPHHFSPPYLPPPFSPPLVIVHMSFIIVPVNPSPFSPIIPSPLPSGHCQPVLNFSVFGYTRFYK